jgi:hypothetical protein
MQTLSGGVKAIGIIIILLQLFDIAIHAATDFAGMSLIVLTFRMQG